MRAGFGDHLRDVFGRGGRDALTGVHGWGLSRVGGVPVDPLPSLGHGERAGQDAVYAVYGAGFHRSADMCLAPGAAAVVARAGSSSCAGWLVGRFSGDDGGLVAARDDQAVCGEGFQGVPDHAGTDALQPAGLGD